MTKYEHGRTLALREMWDAHAVLRWAVLGLFWWRPWPVDE